MKAGSRGSTDTRERFGMRRALVVAQVALSLVLVVGALLFVRSLRNLMTLDAGFRQDGILVVNLEPAARRHSRGAADGAVRRRSPTGSASLPGVDAAAQAFIVPVSGSGWNNNIVIDGKKRKENVNFNSVSDRLFQDHGHAAAGRPRLRRARHARAPARWRSSPSCSRASSSADENPIGQTFQVDEPPGQPQPAYQIVGLAKDTKYTDLREEFTPLVFFAAAQDERSRRRFSRSSSDRRRR